MEGTMSLNDIHTMSVTERLYLMEQLWDSFKSDVEQFPSPKWHQEELEKRRKAYQEGKVKTISFEQLKASLNARV
jgi:putative addiction module component (TIGR02574 family)